MELEILNNREIKPQKVATKQGEAQTTVLKFVRDSYKYDQIDLRNYKAYAVTSFNGEIDMTQLTMTTSGSQLILTWTLSERVLRYAGSIIYQIVFKGTADSAAVFSTYQGIIQNSESIDGDNYISSNYPTIMKQWLDLINARSGEIPYKIIYMLPGQSIPVDERTKGTLYFQWEEVHKTLAESATGQVNLGSSPYADSGLYINGTHVYVDNTSDTVYVLEPSVWVDAINAADCGVIATDVSGDDEVKILLTAKTSGAAGNNITYELGVAQYGAGKGQSNPSGGTTHGSTLKGGIDAQDGVENPIGQMEDHFGNVLFRNGAKHLTNPDLNTLLKSGEYVCSGSDIHNDPIDTTYCIVHVTDSPSTNRVSQECHVISLDTVPTVRKFMRAINGTTVGEWCELMTDAQLNAMSMVPDYANYVEFTSVPFTAPSNGYVWVMSDGTVSLTVDGIYHQSANTGSADSTLLIPIAKGGVVTSKRSDATPKFIPCK